MAIFTMTVEGGKLAVPICLLPQYLFSISYFALPTCKLTEIEVPNIVYCMVMAKISRTKKKKHGDPQFHGRVPNII